MLGPWLRHQERPGSVGRRIAQHVEADASAQLVDARRQLAPEPPLLAVPGTAAEGGFGEHPHAGVCAGAVTSQELRSRPGSLWFSALLASTLISACHSRRRAWSRSVRCR